MAYENAEHQQGIEMRDRAFAKLSRTPGRLETQTLDLDARALALLGKKQRLKVAPNRVRSSLADLIVYPRDSGSSGGSPWLPSLQHCLRLGNR